MYAHLVSSPVAHARERLDTYDRDRETVFIRRDALEAILKLAADGELAQKKNKLVAAKVIAEGELKSATDNIKMLRQEIDAYAKALKRRNEELRKVRDELTDLKNIPPPDARIAHLECRVDRLEAKPRYRPDGCFIEQVEDISQQLESARMAWSGSPHDSVNETIAVGKLVRGSRRLAKLVAVMRDRY